MDTEIIDQVTITPEDVKEVDEDSSQVQELSTCEEVTRLMEMFSMV